MAAGLDFYQFDKVFFECPEIDSAELEECFPVDDAHMQAMISMHICEGACLLVFPFVGLTAGGKPFVDFYIWDSSLPEGYARFVLKDGRILPEEKAAAFLGYSEQALVIDDRDFEEFAEALNRYFPQWNFPAAYTPAQIGDVMQYLFYVSSHRGYHEILYKAGLLNIAKQIDRIPCNLIGTTPADIIGCHAPMKLLRLLDRSPVLLPELYERDGIRHCVNVYRAFSDYIRELPTVGQWAYLERLYDNGGILLGRPFYRAVYHHLEDVDDRESLDAYEVYFGLRDELSAVLRKQRTRVPEAGELMDAIERMVQMREYLEDDVWNRRIRKRAICEKSVYGYADFQYLARLPVDCQDFFQEAEEQHNCLLEYLESHACGGTTIVFVRRMNHRQESYVTVEINKKGVIEQALAKNNERPDREALEFLKQYAYEKGFEGPADQESEQIVGDEE